MSVAMILVTASQLENTCNHLDYGEIHSFYQNLEKRSIRLNELMEATNKLEKTVDLQKFVLLIDIPFPKDSIITEYLDSTKFEKPLEPVVEAETNLLKFWYNKRRAILLKGIGVMVVGVVITIISRKYLKF